MTTGKIAVLALIATVLVAGSAFAGIGPSDDDADDVGAIDLRKDDAGADVDLVDDDVDDDPDGDGTKGADGTGEGNDTGRDGDDSRGNDRTAGGNDTGGDGDDTTGKDGTIGGNDTGRDGDDSAGNDGSGGGENTVVAQSDDGAGFAPAPAAGGGSASGGT